MPRLENAKMFCVPSTSALIFRETLAGASLIRSGPGHTIPVIALDDLQLSRCDLIKADVQGMEREVLVGAAATIETFFDR